MKQIVLYTLLAAAICGCGRDPNRTPVKQVFVHKYGMEMEQDDWEARGRQGEVVTTRKDGVVVRQNYDDGILHGETTLTFPHSSTLASIEDFKQGRIVRRAENYRSGIPQREVVFNGQEQKTTCWYEDGTPQSVEVAQGDFLLSAEYFDPNHALEASVKNGEGIRIHRAGHRIIAEDAIAAGHMIRKIAFHETGEPESITPYVDGQIHGERLTYFEGGLPLTTEDWVRGELHGNVTTFANGEKISERPYVHGVREGTEFVYNSDGNISEEISWKEDQRHGPTRFLADGKEETVDWYFEGKSVRKHTYDRLVNQYAQG